MQAAMAKLLSPAGKDVRTVRLPRVEAAEHGSEQFLQAQAAQGVSRVCCSSSSWPGCVGWKEFTSPEGKKYYHHAPSRSSSWDPPPGMSLYACVCACVCMYICICIVYICIYIYCMYMCVCIYIYIVCICMCVCVCVCV